jgi:hypothetical protein
MSTTVAGASNHFPKPQDGFTTTTSGSISSGATTVGLNSVGSYSNGDVFVGVIEPGVTGSEQTFTGIVDTSGVQITSVVWTRGTNVAHSAGVTVVDYVSATHLGLISKGILVSHNQDGTIKNGAVSTAAMLGADVVTSDKILDGTIAYADLLSTIFSGQVTTAANAGSWGGTQSYINLGGIKLCWGISAVGSAINSGASLTRAVTLPVGFFSTVTAGFCSTYYAAGSFENWLLSEVGPTFSATTVEVIVTNVSSGTSGTTYKVFWLVIGT